MRRPARRDARDLAAQRLRQTDYFAALMLHAGDADMMIAAPRRTTPSRCAPSWR